MRKTKGESGQGGGEGEKQKRDRKERGIERERLQSCIALWLRDRLRAS